MKSFNSLLLASYSLLITASALTFASETIISTLDNLDSTPTNTTSAFKHRPEVGVHNQLHWIGFSVDTPAMDPAASDFMGIPPKSMPNYASAPVVPDFFLPSLTSNYPGSRVVFFDLDHFNWGCSTQDLQHTVPMPGWCSLEIYGYTQGTRLPTAKAVSFFFPKEGATSMELIYAGLPTSFKAVSRVEFKVDSDTPSPMLYIDNVQYSVYNVTDMGNGIGEVIHQQTAIAGARGMSGGMAALRVEGELKL